MKKLDEFLRSLKKFVSQPGPDLADDEEERIFYDEGTGKTRVELVKKTSEQLASETMQKRFEFEEENRYPKWEPFELKVESKIAVTIEGAEFSLEKLHEKEEPEDSEILGVNVGGKDYALHSYRLFQELMDGNSRFICNLTDAEFKELKNLEWIHVGFCDDSRDYLKFEIEDMPIELRMKYMAVEFFVSASQSGFVLLSKGIYDSDSIALPDVINEIACYLSRLKFSEIR